MVMFSWAFETVTDGGWDDSWTIRDLYSVFPLFETVLWWFRDGLCFGYRMLSILGNCLFSARPILSRSAGFLLSGVKSVGR